jgi:hypothetical protein
MLEFVHRQGWTSHDHLLLPNICNGHSLCRWFSMVYRRAKRKRYRWHCSSKFCSLGRHDGSVRFVVVGGMDDENLADHCLSIARYLLLMELFFPAHQHVLLSLFSGIALCLYAKYVYGNPRISSTISPPPRRRFIILTSRQPRLDRSLSL